MMIDCDGIQERLETIESRVESVQMLDSGCQTEALAAKAASPSTAAAVAAAAVKAAAQRLPNATSGNNVTAENIAAFAAGAGRC